MRFSKIEKPKVYKFLIAGSEGKGKTTLGSRFPNPVFMPFEDGLASIAETGAEAFPLIKNSDEIRQSFRELIGQDHDRKTLVVDSITALMRMVEKEIVDKDGSKSINQALGGYGAGRSAVYMKAISFIESCRIVMEKCGMHIVWIGHEQIETVNPPDSPSYDRRTIYGTTHSVSPFIQTADVVAFIKQVTYTASESSDSNREINIGLGEREIVCQPDPGSVAKNRIGVSKSLPFRLDEGNPFTPYIAEKNNSLTSVDTVQKGDAEST